MTDIGDVNDLKVLIEMNHARTGDLIVNIMAPGGFNADLMRRIDDDNDLNCPNNGSQGRLTDLGGIYIFDDQAYSPYGPGMWAAAKYFDFTGLVVPSGHYKASRCDALEVDFNPTFLGVSMTGTWTLTISDHQQSSTGTLQSWGLIINNGLVEPCQCVDGDVNGDGAIDGDDIGPFLDCLFFSIGDHCECADIDDANGVDNADVSLLVGLLLND